MSEPALFLLPGLLLDLNTGVVAGALLALTLALGFGHCCWSARPECYSAKLSHGDTLPASKNEKTFICGGFFG